ncbi:hypothetical protein MFLAVUS_003780 [Mucor flavus]|uniref:F-box domain-containing protein n=1 Tax=Mucor flavus TaxID=439312 RepID=A0ABP9YU27_9FUNG
MIQPNSLPKEVLVTIFQHLPDREFVRSCALVCKHWQDAVNTSLYNNGQDVTFFSEQDLSGYLSLTTTSGRYIKSVVLVLSWKDIAWCIHLMDMLACRLPNLEKIDDNSGNVNGFIWILNDKIKHPTRWPKLTSFGPPMNPSCIEFYNACVLKYASSLTWVQVADRTCTYTTESIFEQEYLALAKRLDEFPKLKRLTLMKQSNGASVESFEHLLVNDALEFVTLKLYGRPHLSIDHVNLITVKPLPRVSKLVISCLPGNDGSLMYIMCKFGALKNIIFDGMAQVYKMEGNFQLCDIDRPSHFYSGLIAAKFLTYLMKIPVHQVDRFYISDAQQVLCYLLDSAFETLKIRYAEREEYEFHADMTIDLRSDDTAIKDFLTQPKSPVEFRILDHTLHTEIIDTYGGLIKRLHLIEAPVFEPIGKGHYLDRIFLSCNKLETLVLSSHAIRQCNPKIGISTSITQLSLRSMVIANQIFAELSVRLPQLSRLILWNCSYSDYNGRLKENKQVMIDMPYTSLTSLTICYLFRCDDREQRQDVLFKICTLKGEKFFNVIVNGINGTEPLELDNILYKSLLATTKTVNYVIHAKSVEAIEFHADDKKCTIVF